MISLLFYDVEPPYTPTLSLPIYSLPKQAPARKITYINEFKLFLPCEIGCSYCCCYCSYCCCCYCFYCCCSYCCCSCCFSPVIYNVSSQRQKLHFHAQFTPIHKQKQKQSTHRHTHTHIHSQTKTHTLIHIL